jgi:periplasmic protein TonB
MTTAYANAEDLSLKRFLGYSAALHAALAVAIAVSAFIQYRGNAWGGVGGTRGGTKVSLVTAAGIPMPKESVVTDSKTVDATKGLYKEEPPKPPEPKQDAAKIPKFDKEKRLPPSPKSKAFESKTPAPDNAVPYGKGGNPDLPTGYSQIPGGSTGVAAQGQGGGDFGARYPWYVDAVRTRIRQAWDQTTIEPAVRAAHRAHTVMTFRINADGTVTNVRLFQTSGNQSMDYSAQRALQSLGSLNRLPNDYIGAYVDVTFDFDLSLMQ